MCVWLCVGVLRGRMWVGLRCCMCVWLSHLSGCEYMRMHVLRGRMWVGLSCSGRVYELNCSVQMENKFYAELTASILKRDWNTEKVEKKTCLIARAVQVSVLLNLFRASVCVGEMRARMLVAYLICVVLVCLGVHVWEHDREYESESCLVWEGRWQIRERIVKCQINDWLRLYYKLPM